MSEKIIYAKNSNNLGKKQFERQTQIYNEIHKNNFSYIERPKYSSKNESNLNVDFSRYMFGGKASLGYNFIYEQNNQKNQLPEKKDNFSRFKVNDSVLPPNIYHNFSTSTRLNKKLNNYDINKRNTYSE